MASLQLLFTLVMGLAVGWDEAVTANEDAEQPPAMQKAIMGGLLIFTNLVVFILAVYIIYVTAEKSKKWANMAKAKGRGTGTAVRRG